MHSLTFYLEKIPDLSLSKYSSLDENGVDGVIKKTSSFLRQINRKGILSKVFFHLLYIYNPAANNGQRLKIYFISSGKEEKQLSNIKELVQNSAISTFYNLKCKEKELTENEKVYEYMAALGKREFYVQPSVILQEDNDLKYYKVAEWEMNENARLYNMLKLMQGFNKPAAFRIDIFPVDYTDDLRKVLPIQNLRKRTSMSVTKNADTIFSSRDENAEEILKQYNDLIEHYASSPHFRANILAFADEQEVAELILDAAGAEALERGNYSIKVFSNLDEKITVYCSMDKVVDVSGENTVKQLKFMPNLFLLNELRSFFSFPALYDGEVIQISKETAPKIEESGLHLGEDENGYSVNLPIALLNKHAFLAGVPGSGKTNTMLHISSSLWKVHKIPFLILEPAKREYRALAKIDGMEELLIFSPSSGTYFPLHINPFEFPCGMSLSEHIRNLMAVFEGAFSLAPPAPFIIDSAIEAVYKDKGWYPDSINEAKLPYPTMSELYGKLAEEVEKTDYEGDIKGNLRSILQVRIGSLLRREMGDVFDVSKSSLSPEEWLNVPSLIELEAMGSGTANFLTLLLSTLIRESLKVIKQASVKKLRHVIFFEEAHNLIGPEAKEATGEDANPKLAATAYIVKMLAEVRALKEGIIIADQLPTAMAPEVIKNTGLKIGHRLTAEDDRNLLGSTMSANPIQLEQMTTFEPGNTLMIFEGMLKPFKVKICKWENGNASYDSPTNEDLETILSDKAGYTKLLNISSQISLEKFNNAKNKIFEKIKQFNLESEELNLKRLELREFLKDNNINNEFFDTENENTLVIKSQENAIFIAKQKQALNEVLNQIFSSINELLVKVKGYLKQNKLHKTETKNLFLSLKSGRENLFGIVNEYYKEFYKEQIEEYENFSNEIKQWEMNE